ncbi:2-dehydro-3-deoxygluconokinase [Asticcacaulis biprosthecium C19]|uniref:2-dehydro-3-deoxygluconokinase n=1 Tax=Asticcacaulis biprosthecium C19 TaxID=715226 RepID=F4QLU9_9CAUL|nr:sugar kinase [Asticcacaulis biprosthecium]EGF92368.1 2-dehydro-3-deoxygluconokinase [Asticcacaulis biprosthecium C19]
MADTNTFVCFGELLVRLTATGGRLLEELPPLAPFVGGAEANVAIGLTRLGHATRMVSIVPDNALGLGAKQELRRWGVDVNDVTTGAGRMGLYFLTPGAIHRPSDILYDRAASAFATAKFNRLNWRRLLKNAGWLHVSGVTAALGANCVAAALKAMQTARELGMQVSYDCNYRPKLWEAWGGDAPKLIKDLINEADLVFGGIRDIELITGEDFNAREQDAAEYAFKLFPNLKRLVGTRRTQVSVDHNRLAGLMFTPGKVLETETYDIERIVDRIGGGDAFAAGVFHGILSGTSDRAALDFGIACACLKHAQPGDASLATASDLDGFVGGGGFDVKR